jgi:hypothetical protein
LKSLKGLRISGLVQFKDTNSAQSKVETLKTFCHSLAEQLPVLEHVCLQYQLAVNANAFDATATRSSYHAETSSRALESGKTVVKLRMRKRMEDTSERLIRLEKLELPRRQGFWRK